MLRIAAARVAVRGNLELRAEPRLKFESLSLGLQLGLAGMALSLVLAVTAAASARPEATWVYGDYGVLTFSSDSYTFAYGG
jgi:hypothetical protein